MGKVRYNRTMNKNYKSDAQAYQAIRRHYKKKYRFAQYQQSIFYNLSQSPGGHTYYQRRAEEARDSASDAATFLLDWKVKENG